MRKQNWSVLLDKFLNESAQKTFKWGSFDCLIFVSDWCKMCCDVDPMGYAQDNDPITIRGEYKSEKEAKDLIKKYRGSMMGIMDLHFERVDVRRAQRGDIVLQEFGEGFCFGIVGDRAQSLFKTPKKGLAIHNALRARLAWRVE